MTSPLPPKRRDSRDLADLVRQDRTRLTQLDRGLAGGRFPPARPLKPHGLGDGDEVDFDEPAVLWEWGDRLVVTAAGRQTFRLSHEPIEESLTIRWHPDGKAPLTQVNERYVLDGQTVTILDAEGDVKPGDVFSAQYQYEDGEDSDQALILVGTGTIYASNPTLALPAGSQVGDFIVIATVTGTVSDGRVNLLADHNGSGLAHFYHYAGTLTNLSDFATTGGTTLATWAVFRAPSVAATPAAQAGPGSSLTGTTTVTNPHAILAVSVRGGLTDAALTIPTGYTLAVQNPLLVHARAAIAYWDAAAEESSPSGPISGIFDDYLISVLGVTNSDVDA